jgi:hypothetical protein
VSPGRNWEARPRIPNAVAVVVAIGLSISVVNVMTGPADQRVVVLVGGLLVTVLIGLIATIALWLLIALRRKRSPE